MRLLVKYLLDLLEKKITMPNTFKSHTSACAIKCSLKANDGFLFPLERSFFFVHKPPTLIRFDDIGHCEFARVNSGGIPGSSSNRTFDFIVTLKTSTVHQFTGIQRQEYSPLFNFITSKKLKKN